MDYEDCVKIDNAFDGVAFDTPDIVAVPDEYVDGTHTRNVMQKSEFPVKIKVRSTGRIYYVYGFTKNGMIYTATYCHDGLSFSDRGTFKGKMGEDFVYV